jgi:LPS export ABC transporter protein LptC/lipopolysaccharide transport protein LptA
MSPWQRRLRLIFALGAVALAIAVALAFQRRAESNRDTASSSDPKALVETIGFDQTRQNRDKEEVRIQAAVMRAYGDGTAKGEKLKVTTVRSGGRTFILTADRALVGKNESSYELEGNVHLTNSDGLDVQSDRASYLEGEGIIRAAGAVTFSRGRMSGSGIGFSYDKNQDRLRILKDAVVRAAAGANAEGEQPPMELTSSTMLLDRLADVAQFEKAFKLTRGTEVIEAAHGSAFLTEDEDRIRRLELRGGSSIAPAAGGPGSLQKMTGRDIDLTYGEDGETLEHALVVGEGVMLVAGEAQQANRRLSADTFDVPLGAHGTRPTALTAKGRVELDLPAESGTAARTITADNLDAKGDETNGLTSATFSNRVVLRERGAGAERSASSELVQVAIKPGFSAIDEATFLKPVEFVDGRMIARAARGRYVLGPGTLDLSGSEPGVTRPNVRDDRISIDANAIDIVLDGPKVHGKGAVRTALQPSKDGADTKTPSMFKKDQPVNVTADDLKYDGSAEQAHYTGNAQLWQAETTIKGAQITIESKSGDLKASGDPVATTAVLTQTTKDGRKEPTRANAKSKELVYQEAERRATYLGEAYLNGPQGELRSPKIELYLRPSGDEVDRVEAYDGIALTEPKRKTAGDRLTYTAADEKYLITGRPVKVEDECSGTTEGRSLTYLKGADRIVVDGSEQIRTRTQGGSKCP